MPHEKKLMSLIGVLADIENLWSPADTLTAAHDTGQSTETNSSYITYIMLQNLSICAHNYAKPFFTCRQCAQRKPELA